MSAAVAEVRALLPQGLDTSPVTARIGRLSMRLRQLTNGLSEARAWLTRGAARASSIRVAAPARAADVKREALAKGFSLATLERARVAMAVKTRKSAGQFNSPWLWSLPEAPPAGG